MKKEYVSPKIESYSDAEMQELIEAGASGTCICNGGDGASA